MTSCWYQLILAEHANLASVSMAEPDRIVVGTVRR